MSDGENLLGWTNYFGRKGLKFLISLVVVIKFKWVYAFRCVQNKICIALKIWLLYKNYHVFENTDGKPRKNVICILNKQINIWFYSSLSGPLQSWSGPEGYRKLRFPDYVTTAQDSGKVVILTHRPLFTPRKYSWYSFLLEAESIPGPWCDRKEFMSMRNSNNTICDRTSDLPICSTAQRR